MRKYNEASKEPYCLIAGSDNKELLIKVKEFIVDKCTNTKKHEKKAYLKHKEDKKLFNLNKDEKVGINVGYPETENNWIMPLSFIFPLKNPIKYTLNIDSCRRNIEIPILVYHNIQWFLGFKFKISKGIDGTNKFQNMFTKDSLKPSRENIKNSLEIGLVATWHDGKNMASIHELLLGRPKKQRII